MIKSLPERRIARRQYRPYKPVPTRFAPLLGPPRLGNVAPTLKYLLASGDMLGRVYVTNAGIIGSGSVKDLREWAGGDIPSDWHRGKSYLEGVNTWVLRFQREDGAILELRPSTEWFPDTAIPVGFRLGDPGQAYVDAYRELEALISGQWSGATVLASPAATGRDCWLRSIPKGVEHESPPEHIAELIRSTSPQGRSEVITSAPWIRDLVEMDGRQMYLALMRELPGRFVEHHKYAEPLGPLSFDLYKPGRFLCTVAVPVGWNHVGLVGRRNPDGPRGWTYPSTPGEHWQTWLESVEVHLLEKQGWPVMVHEYLEFETAKPLDSWANAIVKLQDKTDNDLVKGALRMIALAGLGAFVGRPFLVDGTCPAYQHPPENARNIRMSDGAYHYQIETPVRDQTSVQPHWPATVWARARVRLMSGPGAVGALTVPKANIVAFRTDAIYLTEKPDWRDNGRPGEFRQKGFWPGPLEAPTNTYDLMKLRNRRRYNG